MAVEQYLHHDGVTLPFPEEKRCVAHSKASHERCKRLRSIGLRVCAKHGGATADSVSKRQRTEAVLAMRRFVTPIDAGDPEANVIVAFELEFRRTIARIRYLDEVLAKLDPEALGWGLAEEKDVQSGEYPGLDTTSRAQANIYYVMQMEERKRLVELIKIWIGAKLDVRKLEIEEQKVDALNGVIEAVLVKLGHDIQDPTVRRTVRDSMLALPVAGQTNYVATAKDILSGKSLVREAVKTAGI